MLRRFMIPMVSVLSLSLLGVLGCSKEETKKPSGGGGGGGAAKKADLKAAGYASSLKGRVTYNGDGDAKVTMKAPSKDTTSCPKEVPMDGWYCEKSKDKKGVQYALVFLMPPEGFKMPEPAKEVAEPKTPTVEIGQPRCQFEPRVIALHPKQDLAVKNDSQPPINHDANIVGPRGNSYQKTLKPGESNKYPLEPSDREPNKLNCGIHTDTMGAYVWKMTHPYAVVTNENGEFELTNVPVPEGQKMVLAVWHEMLPGDHFKVIGPVDLEKDKPATKDFAIPK